MNALVTRVRRVYRMERGGVLLKEGQTVLRLDNRNDTNDPRLKQRRFDQIKHDPGFELHKLDITDHQLTMRVVIYFFTPLATPGLCEQSNR